MIDVGILTDFPEWEVTMVINQKQVSAKQIVAFLSQAEFALTVADFACLTGISGQNSRLGLPPRAPRTFGNNALGRPAADQL